VLVHLLFRVANRHDILFFVLADSSRCLRIKLQEVRMRQIVTLVINSSSVKIIIIFPWVFEKSWMFVSDCFRGRLIMVLYRFWSWWSFWAFCCQNQRFIWFKDGNFFYRLIQFLTNSSSEPHTTDHVFYFASYLAHYSHLGWFNKLSLRNSWLKLRFRSDSSSWRMSGYNMVPINISRHLYRHVFFDWAWTPWNEVSTIHFFE